MGLRERELPQSNSARPDQAKESHEEVMAAVREFICQELLRHHDAQLHEHTALIEEGYITSLEAIELALFLERRFQIKVEDDDVVEENFASLASIAGFVEQKWSET
jgi:acyl carrier protein